MQELTERTEPLYRSSQVQPTSRRHPRPPNPDGGGDDYHHRGGGDDHANSLNLQFGNGLRTTHPQPIVSDQVIVVPSLFGGSKENFVHLLPTHDEEGDEDAATVFRVLRDELEPLIREQYKYNPSWTLDSVRERKILTANVSQGTGKGALDDDDDGHDDAADASPEDVDGGDEARFGSHDLDPIKAVGVALPSRGRTTTAVRMRLGALIAVARRVCQYFSIDVDTAHVNAGIRIKSPDSKARWANSSLHPSNNCFVLVTFGSTLKLVLTRQQQPQQQQQLQLQPNGSSCNLNDDSSEVSLSLDNQSAVAIMLDVSNQGWMYRIDKVLADDLADVGKDAGAIATPKLPQRRRETITLTLAGRCTRMKQCRTAATATANAGAIDVRRASMVSDDAFLYDSSLRRGNGGGQRRPSSSSDPADRSRRREQDEKRDGDGHHHDDHHYEDHHHHDNYYNHNYGHNCANSESYRHHRSLSHDGEDEGYRYYKDYPDSRGHRGGGSSRVDGHHGARHHRRWSRSRSRSRSGSPRR